MNRVGRTPKHRCWYQRRLSRFREIPLEITGRENTFGFRLLTTIALDRSEFLSEPIVFVLKDKIMPDRDGTLPLTQSKLIQFF